MLVQLTFKWFINNHNKSMCGSPVAQTVQNLPVMQEPRPGLDPWVVKIPWQREWLHTSVFLRGEFHGQRSLVACSPWFAKSLTRLSD